MENRKQILEVQTYLKAKTNDQVEFQTDSQTLCGVALAIQWLVIEGKEKFEWNSIV